MNSWRVPGIHEQQLPMERHGLSQLFVVIGQNPGRYRFPVGDRMAQLGLDRWEAGFDAHEAGEPRESSGKTPAWRDGWDAAAAMDRLAERLRNEA